MKKTQIHAKTASPNAIFLLILLAFLSVQDVQAQGNGASPLQCGEMTAPPPNGSNPDSLVSDRFGNLYDYDDLLVPRPAKGAKGGGCQSGFFNLTFSANFPMDLQPTVCQVFADLSNLIVPHTNTLDCDDVLPSQLVEINVIWQNITPSYTFGQGSPFYSGPNDGTCDEMVLDRPFIKINGGIANPFPTQMFDGRLIINADPTNFLGNVHYDWHLNWLTPVGQNEVDLYTVTLHETLHILGFASRISNPEHSLWDRILHITDTFVANGTSPNIQPILTNSPPGLPCTSNFTNCWVFNEPEISSTDLSLTIDQTCDGNNGNPDIVVGESAIAAIDWANSGSDPSALSHLSSTCNGSPAEVYVMTGDLSPGTHKRIISQDELQILCEIGYEIASPNFNCTGCYSIANQDKDYNGAGTCCFQTFYTCRGKKFVVLDEELLCNDVTNGPDQIIKNVWQVNLSNPFTTINRNTDNTGWDIIIPANFNQSIVELYYTVTGCDCRQHNAQFKIVVDRDCYDCTFSPDPCDNLVCAGDFENFTNMNSNSVSHLGWPIIFEGAFAAGTPDINVTNTGNHYLHLGDFPVNREAVNLKLKKCIEPGCSLTMSMDLSKFGITNNYIEVWGSLERPCDATIPGAMPIAHDCAIPTLCNPAFEPVCIFKEEFLAPNSLIDFNNPNFGNSGPHTWENESNQNVCYITLVPVGNDLYLDNLSAEITCEPEITCGEITPDSVCQGEIASISFEVCAPKIPDCLSLTLLTPTVTLPSGWIMVGGNPGPFTLTEGDCQSITIQVLVPANAPIGSIEMIMLSGTATGLCTTVEWECSAKVTIVACGPPQAFTCPCPEKSINIDASPASPFYDALLGGVSYAALEAVFNYDNDDDGIIENKEHNNCIAILGNLIIDQELSILSCENIQMQPCSEITVGTNTVHSTLTLDENILYACEIMWQGITITPNAALHFTDNEIRDAQFAITAEGSIGQAGVVPTKMDATGNRFFNDHIGVFFPGQASKVVAHIPFEGNTFKTTANLLPPCDAALPNYSSTLGGYAGVVSLGSSLTVGTPGLIGYANTFGGIRNGIIGERCILTVNRADIQDLIGGPDINPPSFAGAIGNGVVTTDGKAAVVNSKFSHVPRGVFARGSKSLAISNNRMTFMIRGVETLAVGRSVISNNPVIGFADRGILCREVISGGGINGVAHSIEHNTDMYVTPSPNGPQYFSAAIEIDNALSTDIGVASISYNHFSNKGFFGHGIRINGSGGWDIAENILVFQTPAFPSAYFNVGVQLTNTNANYLYKNTITDFDPHSNESTALRLADGTGNKYCCNNTNGSRFGSRFLGACGSTEWRVTDMYNHEFAVYCDAGTEISPQLNYGDNFNNSSGTAFHEGDDNQVQQSRFKVLDMQQPNWPEAIFTPNTNVQFFLDEGTDATCVAPCTAPQYGLPKPDRDIDEADLTTATGGFLYGPYGEALQWENERRLYERMSDYAGMIGADPATDAFYTSASSSKIGAYYQAEHTAKGIYTYSANITNGLQTAEEQLEINRLAVDALLDGLAQAQTFQDSLLIYANANTLFQSDQINATALASYQAQAQAYANTTAFGVYLSSNALPADNLLEQNRKAVQRLYLETVGVGIARLNPNQLIEAEAIATQCPLTGGSAVYGARALYRLNHDRLFSDDSLCIPLGARKQPALNQDPVEGFSLVPNPASDQVTIKGLSFSKEGPVEVSLLDMNGKTCLNRLINSGEAVISTAGLLDGVYICQIKSKGKPPVALKLIVVH